MLYLGLIRDTEAKQLFIEKGIEYGKFSKCVCCKNGEEVLGFCLFDLSDEKITVKYIEPLYDIALADGILRSTLHVATEKSVMNAFYDDTVPVEFLKKIGFIKNETDKTLDIDKLFKSCCECK